MKKGFTLVELLAVIVIIAVISMVILPMVSKQIDESKEDLYAVQVDKIEKAAKDYLLSDGGKNLRKSLLENAEVITISIEELQDKNYLEKEAIKNPLDSTKNMDGVIEVTYENNNYVFKYVGEDTPTKSDSSYRISSYILNTAGSNLQKVVVTNPVDVDTSTNKKEIYYYRGSSPNNYIQIVTGTSSSSKEIWNIVSIDKTNQVIKLVKKGKTKVKWSNDARVTDSTLANVNLKINEYLTKTVYVGFKETLRNKIKKTNWQIGGVAKGSLLSSVITNENTKSVASDVSLLSVSDYLNAASGDECRTMVFNGACQNWLTNLAEETTGYFLRNTVSGEDNKVWTVTREGLKEVEITSELFVHPVIYLSTNLLLDSSMNATSTDPIGSVNNPYILKLTE